MHFRAKEFLRLDVPRLQGIRWTQLPCLDLFILGKHRSRTIAFWSTASMWSLFVCWTVDFSNSKGEYCESVIMGIIGKQGLKCTRMYQIIVTISNFSDCKIEVHKECGTKIPQDCLLNPVSDSVSSSFSLVLGSTDNSSQRPQHRINDFFKIYILYCLSWTFGRSL